MDDETNKEPPERFRNILADNGEEEINPLPEPQPHKQTPARPASQLPAQPPAQTPPPSLMAQLPRLKQPAQVDVKATSPKPETPASPAPMSKLPQSKQPPQPIGIQAATPQATQDLPRREKLLRALWTMTSVISMTVNVVVLIVVILALWLFRGFKLPEGIDITMLNKLLSGLYSNFEKMDRATIQTVIPVDAQIPLDISVPVQTTTQITLSETVVIPNAQVVINTGGLNINSNARVTLPAGTPLTVNLNFELPVQTSIPIHLDVPVNIPMADTELHEPFVGLQEVVKPLYCLVEPAAASSISGEPVCK